MKCEICHGMHYAHFFNCIEDITCYKEKIKSKCMKIIQLMSLFIPVHMVTNRQCVFLIYFLTLLPKCNNSIQFNFISFFNTNLKINYIHKFLTHTD